MNINIAKTGIPSFLDFEQSHYCIDFTMCVRIGIIQMGQKMIICYIIFLICLTYVNFIIFYAWINLSKYIVFFKLFIYIQKNEYTMKFL